MTDTNEPSVEQALKRITKMEKFIANMNIMIQRMTEKMQTIESDNTKNTLRYNSFREDMKKSIGDEVDIRTANFKDDFISIDELRGVKIALKELEIKVKSKVDSSAYHDEMTKKQAQHSEEAERIAANFDKIRKQLQAMMESSKKAQTVTIKSIDDLKQNLENSIKVLGNQTKQKESEISQKLQTLQQSSDDNKRSISQLATSFQANRDAVYSQLNQKKQLQTSKFTDLQRKIADYDKRIREDIFDKLDIVKAATDTVSAREIANHDKMLKQLSSIKIRVVTNQNKIVALAQQLQQKFDTSSGALEGAKDELHNQQMLIGEQVKQLKQTIEQLKKQEEKRAEVKKESPSPKLQRKPSRNVRAQSRVQLQQSQSFIQESATKSRFKNKMQNALINSTNLRQSMEVAEKDSINLVETTQSPNTLPHQKLLQTPTLDLESIHSQISSQMQQSMNHLKVKVGDVEASITILREMIDSKVNESEIIKLQDNKCSKHSFKQLVIKLELLKSFLEKHLPQCQGIKTITFDDSGVSMSTIARFAALRTRQQQRQRDESSKQKSRDKEKEAEKKASQPRFPLMINHSRKRYLTILDRTQYLQESSVKYFPS